MSRVSSIENNLEVIRNRRKKHEENPNADQKFREGRISYSDFLKNQEKYGSGDPGIRRTMPCLMSSMNMKVPGDTRLKNSMMLIIRG